MEEPHEQSQPTCTTKSETESSKRVFTLEDLDKWAKQVRQSKRLGQLRSVPGSEVEVDPDKEPPER